MSSALASHFAPSGRSSTNAFDVGVARDDPKKAIDLRDGLLLPVLLMVERARRTPMRWLTAQPTNRATDQAPPPVYPVAGLGWRINPCVCVIGSAGSSSRCSA